MITRFMEPHFTEMLDDSQKQIDRFFREIGENQVKYGNLQYVLTEEIILYVLALRRKMIQRDNEVSVLKTDNEHLMRIILDWQSYAVRLHDFMKGLGYTKVPEMPERGRDIGMFKNKKKE